MNTHPSTHSHTQVTCSVWDALTHLNLTSRPLTVTFNSRFALTAPLLKFSTASHTLLISTKCKHDFPALFPPVSLPWPLHRKLYCGYNQLRHSVKPNSQLRALTYFLCSPHPLLTPSTAPQGIRENQIHRQAEVWKSLIQIQAQDSDGPKVKLHRIRSPEKASSLPRHCVCCGLREGRVRYCGVTTASQEENP